MKVSLPRRNVWLEWLKNVGCAVIVAVAAGASAVIAAAESLEAVPGNALVVLCGAVGRCLDPGNSQASFCDGGAEVRFVAPPAP